MKALTLWPEWAWAIVHLGKNVENRSWVIPPGLYCLHAGMRFGGRGKHPAHKRYAHSVLFHNARSESLTEEQTDRLYKLTPDDIPFGSIVGVIRVTGHTHPNDVTVRLGWHDRNSVANHIELVSVLPTPIPCRGKLGLWTVPDNITHQLEMVG
jgi:hypothetical protein